MDMNHNSTLLLIDEARLRGTSTLLNYRFRSRAVVNHKTDPADAMSIPYLREAQMTRELFQILQSLQDKSSHGTMEGQAAGLGR